MHSRRFESHDWKPIDLELEKTLHTWRQFALVVEIEIDLEQQPQTPQEKPFKDYFNPLANLSTHA